MSGNEFDVIPYHHFEETATFILVCLDFRQLELPCILSDMLVAKICRDDGVGDVESDLSERAQGEREVYGDRVRADGFGMSARDVVELFEEDGNDLLTLRVCCGNEPPLIFEHDF